MPGSGHRILGRVMSRYGSVNVPITSAGVILYGFILGSVPRSRFVAPLYDGPLGVLPKPMWAALFVSAGVLALVITEVWAVLPLVVVVSAWTIAVVIASVTVETVAPTAGIGWSIIATQLLTSVALRGTKRNQRTVR